ncbi:NAD-dependent deacetylase hst3 [Coemansia javaensis]|uniref:NAD-dependent deacetylase hst3 n=1 Tax=Coemansia javaensis TaxID=2761396 RepID=A0A9W8LG77_9FUNG|nr:NAD-dependent deacetylase hst3 [Coemansia javaensis]
MPETLWLSEKRSQQVQALVRRVAGARRVAVVTGAGISVNCGIPDFRSSSGLFQQIQAAHGDLVSRGRDMFDASVVFRSARATAVFYQWMTHLRRQCSAARPGVVHRFIRQLADRGMLLRSYTQNIDGLERKAGLAVWDPYSPRDSAAHVPWQDAQSVPLHGTMDHLTCQLCASSVPFEHAVAAGDVCAACQQRSQSREACGRRSLPMGKLRPAVVLYEEPHPHCEDIARIIAHDTRALGSRRAAAAAAAAAAARASAADVVLVFGTTLKVPGCRQLVRQLAMAATVTVLVNNEPVCGRAWDGIIDYQVIGCVDDWCTRIQRQWAAQTKITRWTTTRKAPAARAKGGRAKESHTKENRDDGPRPGAKRAATKDPEPTKAAERRAAKRPRLAGPEPPARRSMRIAGQQQQQQQQQQQTAICTC